MKKICVVNNDFEVNKLIYNLIINFRKKDCLDFEQQLKSFLGIKHCYLASCGFAGLHIILESLKEIDPRKRDVIIPAYAAPGLVLPVRRLGLRVRLCDISLKTFNVDISQLVDMITGDTLAVVPVHMFGIPGDVSKVCQLVNNRKTFVVEDFAQSLGTELNNKKVGTLATIGFGSFGRGKNLSLYHGGFIALNSDGLKSVVEKNYFALPDERRFSQMGDIAKFLIFSLTVQPRSYFFLSDSIALFRSKKEQTHYTFHKMGDRTKRLGSLLFQMWLGEYSKRIENGLYYHENLRKLDRLVLPEYQENSKIVFNRFPVIVKDENLKIKLFYKLKEHSIESSFMYERPIHQIYDLGYRLNDFPNANYLAEHLLTLPVHGYLSQKELDKIISIFYDTVK